LAQGIVVQPNLYQQLGCTWTCPVASALNGLPLSAATKIVGNGMHLAVGGFILMAALAAAQPVTAEISSSPRCLLVDADADTGAGSDSESVAAGSESAADAEPDAAPK
jgi:hypothetical protein